jgi:hypothetical protein
MTSYLAGRNEAQYFKMLRNIMGDSLTHHTKAYNEENNDKGNFKVKKQQKLD